MVLAVMACGERKLPPSPPAPAPAGTLSPEWIYQPATEETVIATGAVTVEPGVGPLGPRRLLRTARGDELEAQLVGEANLAARVETRNIGEALDLRPGARATLYRIASGNLCIGAQATHVVWYEPEMIEGRTLALALVAGGAPGETGSTVCRVLRYTRNRTRGDEGIR